MSQYTTGELAKLAGVTVRTVQYYDSRGILVPSDFSEGGRRLYTEDDLNKLRVICFLRDLGIQINSIAEILSSTNAEQVIDLLLEQQLLLLDQEIKERAQQKETIVGLQKELKSMEQFSIENLNDIANIMKNKRELKKVHGTILVGGVLTEAVEIATFMVGVLKGIWWPFGIGMTLAVILTGILVKHYYQKVAYICPECHEVFQPKFMEFFWAAHTPRTRKVTCRACGHKGFCVETYYSFQGE